MPSIGEYMYASEQICIPPTYPYILRQFAKAAIRTQPSDLLRWSTAYFRCLALSLPPPIKPRLEYPIPRDHFGITPGWLRALLYQRQDDMTVKYCVLWERWMGACLNRDTLIEMLCLAGFDDPLGIPWFRFIAVCAAHLSDSLTQTMILVCELLTDEPDGGSAMIPVEVFLDIYEYLANIDASKPQKLYNIHFTDSLLGLVEKKVSEEVVEEVAAVPSAETLLSLESEEVVEEVQIPTEKESESTVSCPDIASDEFKTEEEEGEGGGDQDDTQSIYSQATLIPFNARGFEIMNLIDDGHHSLKSDEDEDSRTTFEFPAGSGLIQMGAGDDLDEEMLSVKTGGSTIYKAPSDDDEMLSVLMYPAFDKGSHAPTETDASSISTGIMPIRVQAEEMLKMDLAMFEEMQSRVVGEDVDIDVEKYKLELLLQGMPQLREGEVLSTTQYQDIHTPCESSESPGGTDRRREEEEAEAAAAAAAEAEAAARAAQEEEEREKPEEVFVEAVPGIGGVVPPRLVLAVVNYFKQVAVNQHGMVMPRNIRHYNCPPLEVVE